MFPLMFSVSLSLCLDASFVNCARTNNSVDCLQFGVEHFETHEHKHCRWLLNNDACVKSINNWKANENNNNKTNSSIFLWFAATWSRVILKICFYVRLLNRACSVAWILMMLQNEMTSNASVSLWNRRTKNFSIFFYVAWCTSCVEWDSILNQNKFVIYLIIIWMRCKHVVEQCNTIASHERGCHNVHTKRISWIIIHAKWHWITVFIYFAICFCCQWMATDLLRITSDIDYVYCSN